jgi:hypothetical protein
VDTYVGLEWVARRLPAATDNAHQHITCVSSNLI